MHLFKSAVFVYYIKWNLHVYVNVILINHYIVWTYTSTIHYIFNSWIHYFTIDYRSWWTNIIVNDNLLLLQYIMLYILPDH